MQQILRDFYPVYRKGPFGVLVLLKMSVKQVICERAKILDENSDILIVFRERQKRYTNAENPWGLLSGVWNCMDM